MTTAAELRRLVGAVREARRVAQFNRYDEAAQQAEAGAVTSLSDALLSTPAIVDLVEAAERYALACAAMPGECTHKEERYDGLHDEVYSVTCDACTPTDEQCVEHEAAMTGLMDAASDALHAATKGTDR